MNMLETAEYHNNACREISGRLSLGGYGKLKEKYPEQVEQIESELEENWSPQAIDKYKKRILAGLKKIGMLSDKTNAS